MCIFAPGNEKQQVFLKKLKKRVFPFSNLLNRDFTICEPAHARQYSKAILILFSLSRSLVTRNYLTNSKR